MDTTDTTNTTSEPRCGGCDWHPVEPVELEPSGTAQVHEFLPGGCRHQWVHDHDVAHCMEAFSEHRALHPTPAEVAMRREGVAELVHDMQTLRILVALSVPNGADIADWLDELSDRVAELVPGAYVGRARIAGQTTGGAAFSNGETAGSWARADRMRRTWTRGVRY